MPQKLYYIVELGGIPIEVHSYEHAARACAKERSVTGKKANVVTARYWYCDEQTAPINTQLSFDFMKEPFGEEEKTDEQRFDFTDSQGTSCSTSFIPDCGCTQATGGSAHRCG